MKACIVAAVIAFVLVLAVARYNFDVWFVKKHIRQIDVLHVESTRLCQTFINKHCACQLTELDVVCMYPRKGSE